MNRERLVTRLILDEGMRTKPYKDTMGLTSIGVGRNLDGVGISESEALYMLDNDIDRAARGLDLNLPWWRNLDDVRQEVLLNMTFNLGINGLLGFKNTLRDMQEGNYFKAAVGMKESRWATQVGSRAQRLADAMEIGRF